MQPSGRLTLHLPLATLLDCGDHSHSHSWAGQGHFTHVHAHRLPSAPHYSQTRWLVEPKRVVFDSHAPDRISAKPRSSSLHAIPPSMNSLAFVYTSWSHKYRHRTTTFLRSALVESQVHSPKSVLLNLAAGFFSAASSCDGCGWGRQVRAIVRSHLTVPLTALRRPYHPTRWHHCAQQAFGTCSHEPTSSEIVPRCGKRQVFAGHLK